MRDVLPWCRPANATTAVPPWRRPAAVVSDSGHNVSRRVDKSHIPTKALNESERVILDQFGIERAVERTPQFAPLFWMMRKSNFGILFLGRTMRPRLLQTEHLSGIVALIGDHQRKYKRKANRPEHYDQAMLIDLLNCADVVCVHEGSVPHPICYELLSICARSGETVIAVGSDRADDVACWNSFISRHSARSRKILLTNEVEPGGGANWTASLIGCSAVPFS